jgi:curved DNA-binding protein CbpA
MVGVSPVQAAKRALVVLLRALAAVYGITLDVTRESSDTDVTKAFKKVSGRVHPDKGGAAEDSQRLNAARDAWKAAEKTKDSRDGRQPTSRARSQPSSALLLPVKADARKGYRVQGEAVLLTYQGFSVAALAMWRHFLEFVRHSINHWRVKHWSATLETERGWHQPFAPHAAVCEGRGPRCGRLHIRRAAPERQLK